MNKIIQLLCLILIVFSLNIGISTSVFSDYEVLDKKKIEVALLPVELDFYLADKNSVGFRVENIGSFVKLNYTIDYSSAAGERQIAGEINLNGETSIFREGLILGSCSGEDCHYDEGINKITLNLELIGQERTTENLTKQISL
ncbi:MAG: hypothetical protein ACOX50_04905 [Patescibacteria group bacterium]|jgi:hypothetical protein